MRSISAEPAASTITAWPRKPSATAGISTASVAASACGEPSARITAVSMPNAYDAAQHVAILSLAICSWYVHIGEREPTPIPGFGRGSTAMRQARPTERPYPAAQPLKRHDREPTVSAPVVAPADPMAYAGHRIDPER